MSHKEIPSESKNPRREFMQKSLLGASALRVRAAFMGMGQAAGATTALAVRDKITPSSVPLEKIHGLLLEHNAIVPEKS